jgi:MFS family permease
VWPVDTWVSLATLIPVGMAAEVVGYRTVAMFGLLCRQATRVILIWGKGVGVMAVMQAVYAIGSNCDVILLTLLYTAVPARRFKTVTAIAFAAQHAGLFVGSGVGQAMVDSDSSNLRRLFYVSWAFTTAGMLAFVTLCGPPTRKPPPPLARLLIRDGPSHAWAAVRKMYRAGAVRRWACWYFVAQSVYGVILNYYQNQVRTTDALAATEPHCTSLKNHRHTTAHVSMQHRFEALFTRTRA